MGVNKVALILLIANLIVAYVSGIVVYSKSNLQLKKRSRPGTVIIFGFSLNRIVKYDIVLKFS